MNVPQLQVPPYAEELYDHRGETLQDFTHLELVNLLARRPSPTSAFVPSLGNTTASVSATETSSAATAKPEVLSVSNVTQVASKMRVRAMHFLKHVVVFMGPYLKPGK